MIFQKVLLTGAAGGLGRVLRPALRKELEFLRSTDINPMDPPEANEETIVADDFWSVPQICTRPLRADCRRLGLR